MSIRWWWLVACVVGLVACGTQELTAEQYAVEIEGLVQEMEDSFAAADAAWEGQTPNLEGAREYWDERLHIRSEFLEDLEQLATPPEVADMHSAALEVFERIADADIAIAELVASYDDIDEHRPWRDSPEGRASLAVLEEVFEFCRSSQAEFDATSQREDLEEVPWLPPEMSSVIKVAFGCPPAE